MTNNSENIKLVNNLNMTSPIQGIQGDVVVASDTNVLSPGALYVGTTGNVKARLITGSILTFKNVADGSFLPIIVDMVYLTDTTASDIIIIR